MEELNGRAEMEMRNAGKDIMAKAKAKKEAEAKENKTFVSPDIGLTEPPTFYLNPKMHAIWFAMYVWDNTITPADLQPEEPNDRSLVAGVKYWELKKSYEAFIDKNNTLTTEDNE